MAIRYDQSLLDEIRKTVKNYQAKRQRVLQKGGKVIPESASVKSFLTDYTDRRTLLRDLAKLQRYSIRGAEEVINLPSGEITQYELGELKRQVANAKRNLTRQIKELESSVEGRFVQPLEQSEIDSLKYKYQYLSRSIPTLDKRAFKIFSKTAYVQSDTVRRRQTFYKNIFEMLDGVLYGVDQKLVNRFYWTLGGLTVKQLTDLVQNDPQMNSIIDYYLVLKAGGNVGEMEPKIESLIDYLNQRKKG